MGKLSRDKGARYEREVAKRLNSLRLFSADWVRETGETQQGNIGDVVDNNGIWPLDNQAKHRKVINVRRALKEAEEASEKKYTGDDYQYRIPVAWLKWHGGEEIVAMRPDAFCALLVGVHYHVWDEVENGFAVSYKDVVQSVLADLFENV